MERAAHSRHNRSGTSGARAHAGVGGRDGGAGAGAAQRLHLPLHQRPALRRVIAPRTGATHSYIVAAASHNSTNTNKPCDLNQDDQIKKYQAFFVLSLPYVVSY